MARTRRQEPEIPHEADLQRAFHLIFELHRNHHVAACILVEACQARELIIGEEKKRLAMQDKRHPDAPGLQPYKLALPVQCVLQAAVYLVSNRWERAQESAQLLPMWMPPYHPTAEDRLVRYVKELVWQTMQRRPVYAAVALGCSLYTYRPPEISQLVPWAADNIHRSHGEMLKKIGQRFPDVLQQESRVCTRMPTLYESTLVTQALEIFTPWTGHIIRSSNGDSTSGLWATHFREAYPSERAEWQRVHALIDPRCAGLVQLICEYNALMSGSIAFEDPTRKLGIPHLGDSPVPPGERFPPAPLSQQELGRIRHSLMLQYHRRRGFRALWLAVYVDGHEQMRLDHPVTSSYGQCTVLAGSAYVEVIGYDAAGPLLLAVWAIAEEPVAEAGGKRHWVLQHEAGPRLALIVRQEQRADGERLYRLTLAYDAPQGQTVPLVLRTAIAAPVWRVGKRCFYT